jgi:hypothetical protein
MSLLGQGGTLTFSRAPREILVLTPQDRREQSNTFQTSGHALWSGDFVELSPESGPALPPYYETCFVHIDRLRRISLYTSKQEALAGDPSARMPLPESGDNPLRLRPLDGDYDVSARLGEWTLHTDAVYLNESLVERQLGSGALALCACGGQLSFTYETESARSFIRDVATISNLLENNASLTASFEIQYDSKHQLAYSLGITPLAHVINYRDLPNVEGTVDFSATHLPQLRQI